MPTLFLTGQKPLRDNKQAYFQRLNIPSLMSSVTKKSCQVSDSREVLETLYNSLKSSLTSKQGPTHVELPEDIMSESLESDSLYLAQPSQKIEIFEQFAGAHVIKKAFEDIESSNFPIIILGARSSRGDIYKSIRNFVNETGLMVISTQMGKGVVDESESPYFLGNAAVSDHDYVHEVFEKADLIICIGHDSTEKPPFIVKKSCQRKLIHIDDCSTKVHSVYRPSIEVIGCIKYTLNELCKKAKSTDFKIDNPFKSIKSKHDSKIKSSFLHEQSFDSVERIVSDVRNFILNDGVISLDNGLYKVWFSRNFLAKKPNTILLDNALATMGAGLSAAIVTKMIKPEKKVIAICGDGGFMMNSQEILTAKSLGLKLVIIVLVDSSYGMIKWKQDNMGLTDFGMDFENPDFQLLAKSYGISADKVSKSHSLPSALDQGFQNDGITLIEMPINYYTNHQTIPSQIMEQYEIS